jgi:hypothetical protein
LGAAHSPVQPINAIIAFALVVSAALGSSRKTGQAHLICAVKTNRTSFYDTGFVLRWRFFTRAFERPGISGAKT